MVSQDLLRTHEEKDLSGEQNQFVAGLELNKCLTKIMDNGKLRAQLFLSYHLIKVPPTHYSPEVLPCKPSASHLAITGCTL